MQQVICDEDGIGGGVVDILKCKGFVALSTPQFGAKFDMLKSQCAYRLAELINQNLIYDAVTDPALQQQIKEELEQLKKKSDSEDRKAAIMPKDKMKDYLGRSPDDLDTFIMRAWPELQIKKSTGLGMTFHK
jgi:phage terminase large subunit